MAHASKSTELPRPSAARWRLDRWAAWLRPHDDPESLRRARVLAGTLLTLMASSALAATLILGIQGVTTNGLLALACPFFYSLLAAWARARRSTVGPGAALVVGLVFVIAGAMWSAGELSLAGGVWWILTPLFAAALVGRWLAIVCVGLIGTLLVAFELAASVPGLLPAPSMPEPIVGTVSVMCVAMCAGLFGWLHDASRTAFERELLAHQRAERALTSLGAAVDKVDDAVLLLDDDERITYANAAAIERLLGVTRAASETADDDVTAERQLLIGRHLLAGDEAARATAHAALRHAARWRGSFAAPVQGKRRMFAASISRVSTLVVDGEVTDVVVAIVRDVTDDMADHAKRREAQKLVAVGQLAAGMAHELNTPVQYAGDSLAFLADAIHEFDELVAAYDGLRGACSEPDSRAGHRVAAALHQAQRVADEVDYAGLRGDLRDAIERASKGIGRIAEVVRAMRGFARPDVTGITAVDVEAGLRDTLTVARGRYDDVADVELDLGDVGTVPGEPGALNQVWLSLITNAAQAVAKAQVDAGSGMRRRGTIRIATRRHPDGVDVTIADDGCGMSDAVRERMFEPFFTTRDVGDGAGQGLALARACVVDGHGGAFAVDSASGQGTTVRVWLPDLRRDDTVDRAAS